MIVYVVFHAERLNRVKLVSESRILILILGIKMGSGESFITRNFVVCKVIDIHIGGQDNASFIYKDITDI